MDWLKSGFYAVLPYIAASVGVLLGGYISDMLIRRTGSANLGRKLPIVAGLLLASTIILANYVDEQRAGDRDHVDRLLRPGHGQSRLDPDLRRRAEAADRPDRRRVQPLRQPGRHRHAARGRLHRRRDRLLLRRARLSSACSALIGAAAYIFIVGDVRRVEID